MLAYRRVPSCTVLVGAVLGAELTLLLEASVRVAEIVIGIPLLRACLPPVDRRPGLHPGHPTAEGGLPASKPGLLLALMTFNQLTKRATGFAKIMTPM
jgi:hypothetical protein